MQTEHEYKSEAATLFNKATNYLNKNRAEKAVQFYKKALALYPVKEVYANYSNALCRLNRDDEARELLEIACDPNTPNFAQELGPYPLGLCNKGMLSYRDEDDEAAIRYYVQALSLQPDYPGCVWNYSSAQLRRCCSLKSTDWDMAWKTYNFRFQKFKEIDLLMKQWDGSSFVDTIVVLSEQGLGDKIQFARYLQLLKAHCNRLVVQIPDQLQPLFGDYETVLDITPFLNTTAVGVPFCSLAGLFGVNSAPAEWIDVTKFEPKYLGSGVNIIVEGVGSKIHVNDHNRSCGLDHLLPLGELGNLWTFGKDYKTIKGLNTRNSWKSTAEAILGSDVLVTIDTSVAHLCGSLGHPCVLLQPLTETDWRWGDSSMGIHNLWYPSVFVVRNPRSWKKTVEGAVTFLRKNQC